MAADPRAGRAVTPPEPGPPLPGFEGVNRYWDRTRKVHAAKILPGEFYVTDRGEVVVTVLGSCVSACIRDPATGVGGMNHFMLPDAGDRDPERWAGTTVNAAARYGSHAMEYLCNAILAHGGRRDRLQVKVFGGGRILAAMSDIGARNIHFVRGYLRSEALSVVGEDLGGEHPRKVIFEPATGRAWVKKLRRLRNDTIIRREFDYRRRMEDGPVPGGVELF